MKKISLILILLFTTDVSGNPVTYREIEQRFGESILETTEWERAQVEGECLAGIYRLNAFQGDYDPIHEWLRVRTSHLLQRHSPCELLVMLEAAKSRMEALRADRNQKEHSE